MWWVKQLFKYRSLLFKLMAAGLLLIMLIVVIIMYSFGNKTIVKTIMLNQTNKAIANITKDISSNLGEAVNAGNKYPITDNLGNDVEYKNGDRGNGVNLLLLNNIKTEGYVKDILTLYAESQSGTLNSYKHHLSVSALLGIQYNETKSYYGSMVKSYIPFDPSTREVKWKQPYGSIPGEAMTVRMLNKNTINTAPKAGGSPTNNSGLLPYTINSLNPLSGGAVSNAEGNPSRDIGPFQVNRTNFSNTGSGGVNAANISGYGEGQGRLASDSYYLPDNLAYLDREYTNMIETYNLQSITDSEVLAGTYSIYHNGGVGSWSFQGGYGVKTGEYLNKVENSDEAKKENAKHLTAIAADLLQALKEHPKASRLEARQTALVLLFEKGYYINNKAFSTITSTDAARNYLTAAWNTVHGTNLSYSDVKTKVYAYVKNVNEAYPGYADSSTFQSVYGYDMGFSSKSSDYGAVYKLSESTSSRYKKKIGGKDPRVIYLTSIVTSAHMMNSMGTGMFVYADMLGYAGVNVDLTNPDSYMDKLDNEFKPAASDFAAIIKKIGVKIDDQLTYDMLKYGYDHSGFWYYLGGQALPIGQKAYAAHKAYSTGGDFSSGSLAQTRPEYFLKLYATKDGSKPNESTPNSNYVNAGKILFDCSSFTAYAYDNVVKKAKGGSKLVPQARQQLTSNLLTTINKSQLTAGDLLVNTVHVFFYLGKHKGNSVALDTNESLTEKQQSANAGYHWVLEAPTSNKKVGIRVRTGNFSDYTARRFNALK